MTQKKNIKTKEKKEADGKQITFVEGLEKTELARQPLNEEQKNALELKISNLLIESRKEAKESKQDKAIGEWTKREIDRRQHNRTI